MGKLQHPFDLVIRPRLYLGILSVQQHLKCINHYQPIHGITRLITIHGQQIQRCRQPGAHDRSVVCCVVDEGEIATAADRPERLPGRPVDLLPEAVSVIPGSWQVIDRGKELRLCPRSTVSGFPVLDELRTLCIDLLQNLKTMFEAVRDGGIVSVR